MEKRSDSRILCLCLNVSCADIECAVEQGARTFEEVQRLTGCGKSCSMCADTIRSQLDFILRQRNLSGSPDIRVRQI